MGTGKGRWSKGLIETLEIACICFCWKKVLWLREGCWIGLISRFFPFPEQLDHIEEGLDNINNEMKVTLASNGNDNDFAYNHFWPTIWSVMDIRLMVTTKLQVAEKALKKMGRFCGLCTAPWRRWPSFLRPKTWSFFSNFVFTIFVTRVENLMRSRLLQIQKPENWLTMRREKLSFQRSIFKLVCLLWKGFKTWFDHWKVKIGNFSSKRVSDIHSDQKISNYTLSLSLW